MSLCLAGFKPGAIPLGRSGRAGVRRASATAAGQRPTQYARARAIPLHILDFCKPIESELEARWFHDMYHQHSSSRNGRNVKIAWRAFCVQWNIRVEEYWQQQGHPGGVWLKNQEHLKQYEQHVVRELGEKFLQNVQAAVHGESSNEVNDVHGFSQPLHPNLNQQQQRYPSQQLFGNVVQAPAAGMQPAHLPATSRQSGAYGMTGVAHTPVGALPPLQIMHPHSMLAPFMQPRPPRGHGRGGKDGKKRCMRCTSLAQARHLPICFIGKAKPHCCWCFHFRYGASDESFNGLFCDQLKCRCSLCP